MGKYEKIHMAKTLATSKRHKCPMCKAPVGVFIGKTIKCWQCGYVLYNEEGW